LYFKDDDEDARGLFTGNSCSQSINEREKASLRKEKASLRKEKGGINSEEVYGNNKFESIQFQKRIASLA